MGTMKKNQEIPSQTERALLYSLSSLNTREIIKTERILGYNMASPLAFLQNLEKAGYVKIERPYARARGKIVPRITETGKKRLKDAGFSHDFICEIGSVNSSLARDYQNLVEISLEKGTGNGTRKKHFSDKISYVLNTEKAEKRMREPKSYPFARFSWDSYESLSAESGNENPKTTNPFKNADNAIFSIPFYSDSSMNGRCKRVIPVCPDGSINEAGRKYMQLLETASNQGISGGRDGIEFCPAFEKRGDMIYSTVYGKGLLKALKKASKKPRTFSSADSSVFFT